MIQCAPLASFKASEKQKKQEYTKEETHNYHVENKRHKRLIVTLVV